jgi:hypothetical protein
MIHAARRRSATSATAPMIIPTIVLVAKLLSDAGCIGVVSTGGLVSVYVDDGPGVAIGVWCVVCVVRVADELILAVEVSYADFVDSEEEVWSEDCEDRVKPRASVGPVIMASSVDDSTNGVRDWRANSCMSHLTDVVVAL